jgi:hypothetical protein
VQPGDLSPDRLWRWDGAGWIPAAAPNMPSESTLATQSQAATARRSPLAIAGGIVAVVGGLLIIPACALNYIHYTDSTQPSSLSVFNPGYDPSRWFAAEPVGVAVLAIAAGVVLLVWASRVPRAVASGVLLAYGAQTFLLFVGYVGQAAFSQSAQVGPGGVLGMFAGAVILVAGVLAMMAVSARNPA